MLRAQTAMSRHFPRLHAGRTLHFSSDVIVHEAVKPMSLIMSLSDSLRRNLYLIGANRRVFFVHIRLDQRAPITYLLASLHTIV